MRFRYLVLLAALALPCSNARAQNTLAAAIFANYRVAPVIPFAAFDRDSEAAPLPGTTIADISRQTLDGTATIDVSAATVCASPRSNTGKFRGTQGFRQTFPATNQVNRAELRLLFGFDDRALAAVEAYEVTVSSASFLTIPYDRLLDGKAQTRVLGKCAGAASSRTVIKPVVANVAVTFRLARPFSDEAVRALQTRFSRHSHETQNLEYRLSIHRNLIALGIED